jgi:hypothetical protein
MLSFHNYRKLEHGHPKTDKLKNPHTQKCWR